MIFSSFDIIVRNTEAKKLVRLLNIQSGFNIAEIGAGKGRLSLYLAKAVGLMGSVFATEFDEKKVKKIKYKIQKANIVNLQTALAGSANPNLPDKLFDIILMSKVYHHFTNAPIQNLEFYRHLKPQGRLAIIDFEPRWYLKLSTPKNIPKSYGGHGIHKNVLINEVLHSGFKLEVFVENFSGGMYCAVFTKV